MSSSLSSSGSSFFSSFAAASAAGAAAPPAPTTWLYCKALDQGQALSRGFQLALQGSAGPPNELVGQDKDEEVCVLCSDRDVRESDDVLRKSAARKIFHIFVLRVDDLGQLATVHLLFKHPHGHLFLESVRKSGCIVTNKSSNRTHMA